MKTSVTGSDGYETTEVFLVNRRGAPVTFMNAVLDGTALPGEKDRASYSGDRLSITIPNLDAFRLVWIPNRPPAGR